jgi:hypothetical protein
LLSRAKPDTQSEIRKVLAQVSQEVAAKAAPRSYAGRRLGVDRMQIDHLIVLDHAEPFALCSLKPDNLHEMPRKTKRAPECPGARS